MLISALKQTHHKPITFIIVAFAQKINNQTDSLLLSALAVYMAMDLQLRKKMPHMGIWNSLLTALAALEGLCRSWSSVSASSWLPPHKADHWQAQIVTTPSRYLPNMYSAHSQANPKCTAVRNQPPSSDPCKTQSSNTIN